MGCEQRPRWLRISATVLVSLGAVFIVGLCCHFVYKVRRSEKIPKLLWAHWVYIMQSASGFMTILTFLLWFWSPHKSGLSIVCAVGNLMSAFFMGVFLFEMHIVSLNAFDNSMYAISEKLKQQYRAAGFILLLLYTVLWLVADTIASLAGNLVLSLLEMLLFILIGVLYFRIFHGFVSPLVSLIASTNVSRFGGVTRATRRIHLTKHSIGVAAVSHSSDNDDDTQTTKSGQRPEVDKFGNSMQLSALSVPTHQPVVDSMSSAAAEVLPSTPEAEAMDEEDFEELREPSFIRDKKAIAAVANATSDSDSIKIGSTKLDKKTSLDVPRVENSLPTSKPSISVSTSFGQRLSSNFDRLRKQTLSDFDEKDHGLIHTAAKHSTLFMWVGIGGILWLASLKLNHCGSLQFLIALLFTLTMEVCCAFTSYLIFSNTGNEKVYALFCSTSHRCCVKLTACFVETEEEAVVTRKSQEKL